VGARPIVGGGALALAGPLGDASGTISAKESALVWIEGAFASHAMNRQFDGTAVVSVHRRGEAAR